MGPKTIRRDDVKALSPADRSAICSIMFLRCLTEDQMYQFYYCQENPRSNYCSWHIKKLVEHDYLNAVEFRTKEGLEIAYFLTVTGMKLAKRLIGIPSTHLAGIPSNWENRNFFSKDLKLHHSKINHQTHMNTFALKFAEMMGEQPFEYCDEKYVPFKDIYSMRARPDGQAQIGNQLLYFEMDMGTERVDSLVKKWSKYQVLTGTTDFFENIQKNNISILFILDNISRTEARAKTVIKSLEKIGFISQFRKELEFYIGDSAEMIDLSENFLVPQKPLTMISNVSDILYEKFHFESIPFHSAIVPDSDFFGKIDDQLFSIDVCPCYRGSAMARITTGNRDSVILSGEYKTPVSHITITKSVEQALDLVKLLKCEDMIHNYYASIDDLKTKPFQKAIFQVDSYGKMQRGG